MKPYNFLYKLYIFKNILFIVMLQLNLDLEVRSQRTYFFFFFFFFFFKFSGVTPNIGQKHA